MASSGGAETNRGAGGNVTAIDSTNMPSVKTAATAGRVSGGGLAFDRLGRTVLRLPVRFGSGFGTSVPRLLLRFVAMRVPPRHPGPRPVPLR